MENENQPQGGAVVVVTTPPVAQPSSLDSSENDQAIQFGQLLESHRQLTERQQRLEAELEMERQQSRETQSRLDAQLSEILRLAQAAEELAEETENEDADGLERVTPEPEPQPEPEPEPEPQPKIENPRWLKFLLGA